MTNPFSVFFKDISGKNIVYGVQHMFVMFGATILVPIITGLDPGVALFTAGIGTILFHLLTKCKVPVFLGSSFAFMPGILAITGSGGTLAQACGGIVIAGLFYVVMSIIFKLIGTRIIHKILPPQVTGPVIILIGLMLAGVAIQNSNGTNSPGFNQWLCWLIALITFATGIFVKIFFERIKLKFLSSIPVLIALIIGYIAAVIAGFVNFKSVIEAPWFGLPNFSLPVFDLNSISIIVPIAIVTMVEHFGDILAIGNVVKEDYIKDPGIHRTLLGDGLATSLAAVLGGPANTTYSENTGAVALTGVSAPVIMRIAALCAILLSFIPKFTAIINTIPAPVIGGISILLFGMISSIGVKNMIDAKLSLEKAENLIVVSAILVLGLGGAEFVIGNFALKGLGLAAIVGIILNAILNFKDFFKKNDTEETKKA